jgi:hypothetical protein
MLRHIRKTLICKNVGLSAFQIGEQFRRGQNWQNKFAAMSEGFLRAAHWAGIRLPV